jgi:hypothetical protein
VFLQSTDDDFSDWSHFETDIDHRVWVLSLRIWFWSCVLWERVF